MESVMVSVPRPETLTVAAQMSAKTPDAGFVMVDVNNKERGIDLMTPVYNLMDLTPQGRDNWYAKLDYGSPA
jgi:predicted dithiol-disulfide oxidoreductase (DUF899 family)